MLGNTFCVHTAKGISASIASLIAAAAIGGGTKMALAVAPVSLMASFTEANTGWPKCVWPAFFGFVPPTTLDTVLLRDAGMERTLLTCKSLKDHLSILWKQQIFDCLIVRNSFSVKETAYS